MIDISYDEIEDFTRSNQLCARLVGHKYDLKEVREKIKSIPQPIKKDGRGLYGAVGLQYKEYKDRFYDSVESIRFINEDHVSKIETHSFKEWDKWNELGDVFEELRFVETFHKLYRTRFLVAEPGGESVRHIDYDWRFHIPITSNELCRMHYDDVDIHLPADGHAYLINAGFVHSYSNWGTKDRWHFCGILDLENVGDGRIKEVFPDHGSN